MPLIKLQVLLGLPLLVFVLLFFFIFVRLVKSAPAEHIVISEIQLGITGDTENEFIELYNPTGESVNVSGWVLARKTAVATEHIEIAIIPSSTFILPYKYYLVAHEDYTGTVSADLTYSLTSLASNNTYYLKDSEGEVVDKIGLGTANDFEGTVKGNPSAGASVERKANGESTTATMTTGVDQFAGNAWDTDNNANDFVNRSLPDPQNSQSPAEPALESPDSTPTLSPSPSVEPSTEPSTEPSLEPSPTPSLEPIPSPSPSLTPTPSPSPTNSPTISLFNVVCSARTVEVNFRFFSIFYPVLTCRLQRA